MQPKLKEFQSHLDRSRVDRNLTLTNLQGSMEILTLKDFERT